ncbi:Solute carrier organic anion transporter family member 4A1 [Geodia barretti]|nr:Solute carrier organic anion transporter family member 4A1 [Geodia barretti]
MKLIFFLLLIGLGLFTVFMLQIPNVLVTIRCVAEDQRTLAIGTQSFFWRLLGSIPGPILFGAIFDSTCLFWQHECGRRGNCWVYNNTALSQRAVVLAALAMAGYFTCVFLCWCSTLDTSLVGRMGTLQ